MVFPVTEGIYQCAQSNTNKFLRFQLQMPPFLINLLLLSHTFLFIHTNIFYTNFFTEFLENRIFNLQAKRNGAKIFHAVLQPVKHPDNHFSLLFLSVPHPMKKRKLNGIQDTNQIHQVSQCSSALCSSPFNDS